MQIVVVIALSISTTAAVHAQPSPCSAITESLVLRSSVAPQEIA